MDRMTPKQPLIIINWTYPEMLVWIASRKLIDVLVSLTEQIASKLGHSHPSHKSNPAQPLWTE
jgi:hypothetical protein